jgi:hypothetical protein
MTHTPAVAGRLSTTLETAGGRVVRDDHRGNDNYAQSGLRPKEPEYSAAASGDGGLERL